MRRVVIKVGSHVLTQDGKIALDRLNNLVKLIASLHQNNKEVILVSSGAVAAGFTKVAMDRADVKQKQALAAIGQPLLLNHYQDGFNKFNIIVAQVLLTADDFDSRKRTKYAQGAIETLLENRVIPIINENDVTATEELLFGDNDRLSAHVTHFLNADILAILSDIDAYYTDDPNKNPDAKPRAVVNRISSKELIAKCTPNGEFATGGIVTKLQAANFLLEHGRSMFLASGFNLKDARSFLLNNKHIGGTVFTRDEI